MKWFERASAKIAKSASSAVKEEVKSTAIDMLPTVIGLGGMIIGAMIFKGQHEKISKLPSLGRLLPDYSRITITTNNYYFDHASEEERRRIYEQHEQRR